MKLPATLAKPAACRRIFRRAANGGILFWEAELHPTEPKYRSRTGEEGGTIKISAWTTCTPRNEGKSNARTAREQTLAQAGMKRDKLLRKGGYHATRDTIDEAKFFSPMTAQKYKDVKPAFPLIGQPKFDGGRALTSEKGVFSRYGDDMTVAVPHVFKEVGFFIRQGTLPKGIILDGEIYNHDLAGKLNRIMSILRKKKLTEEEVQFSKENAFYFVYDCYDPARPDLPLEERLKIISRLKIAAAALSGDRTCFRFTLNVPLRNEEELEEYYRQCLEKKYEGTMLRVPGSPYESGCRSKNLLKYKPRYDAEYPIVSIEQGNGKRANMAAKAIIRLPDGKTSKVNFKWKDEEKIRIWNDRDKLVGTLATVSYACLTEFGVPFHPYVEKLHYSAKRKI